MITSNMNEIDRNRYISYISSRYNGVWRICTRGREIFPVIGISSIERIFGMIIDKTKVPPRRMKPSGYDEYCDIQEAYFDKNQFEAIANTYRLCDRKAYRDLLVAHKLELYNNNLIDELGIWADDMYNAAQLNREFYEALHTYCTNHLAKQVSIKDTDFSIEVNHENEICYKELMDFAHYEGTKPEIRIRMKTGRRRMKGVIQPNDYEMQYRETSYNIRINNIQFT